MQILNIKTLLLLLVFYPLSSFSQSIFPYIHVTWNDFTPKDLKHEVYEARIGVFHNCEMSYLLQNNTVEISLFSSIKLDKQQSLVDKNFIKNASKEASQELLDHEIGHLLITLYHHFLLIDLFQEHQFSNNYKEELRQLIQKITKQKDEMNNLYDKETHHHINKKQQNDWNKLLDEKIQPYLNKYNNYYNITSKRSISF